MNSHREGQLKSPLRQHFDELADDSVRQGKCSFWGMPARSIKNRLQLMQVAVVLLAAGTPAVAADLKPETVARWEDYVKGADARNQQHLVARNSFLLSDSIYGQRARVRGGATVVWAAGPHTPSKVPNGLIHDWIGPAFIPNATLQDVFARLRDYQHYPVFYQPNVIDSRPIATSSSNDRFELVLMNKSVIAKTALDSEYAVSYARLDDHRWYSITDATHIREIADFDTPLQHELPENHGTGLIWRLHSVARFEESDGGVYVEIEAIALSRDIPAALRWVVEPIVRRVSKSSMVTSLQQTEAAVLSHSAAISAAPVHDQGCSSVKACVSPANSSPTTAFTSLR